MDREKQLIKQAIDEEEQGLRTLRAPERSERMLELAAQAGEAGDVDRHIEWLKRIMRLASKEGRLDFKLRAFAEMRQIYNADVRYGHLRRDLLWYYKWILEELPKHAEVPAEKIEEVFADMEAFYRSEGESVRPAYSLRFYASICMGKLDEAKEWHQKWEAEASGKLDDCAACEIDRKIIYLLEFDPEADVLETAMPLLKGKVWCNDSPAAMTRLIGPALRAKKIKLGLAILKAMGRPVRKTPNMISALATHVVHRLLSGDVVRSRRLAIVSLRRGREAHYNDVDRFNVYRACTSWASLAVMTGRTTIMVPKRVLPDADEKVQGNVGLPELAEACFGKASEIAAKLDARNGTARYGEKVKEMEEMIRKLVETIARKRQELSR